MAVELDGSAAARDSPTESDSGRSTAPCGLQDGLLQHALKFPDITRPAIGTQRGRGSRRDDQGRAELPANSAR